MKTILLIIGGMSDIPDELFDGKTPMEEAYMPSLQALAQRGAWGSYIPVEEGYDVTAENALLSLFGYDIAKGEPGAKELADFYLASNKYDVTMPASALIVPYFSDHGTFITNSLAARGIARLAFLNPTDFYTQGSSAESVASFMAEEAINNIKKEEFVVIYINSPAVASLSGNPYEKKDVLEMIDSNIISPIADFVWHSQNQTLLAVTSGYTASWRQKRITNDKVPVAIYFNDDSRITHKEFNEKTAQKGSLKLKTPYSLMWKLAMFDPPFNTL